MDEAKVVMKDYKFKDVMKNYFHHVLFKDKLKLVF